MNSMLSIFEFSNTVPNAKKHKANENERLSVIILILRYQNYLIEIKLGKFFSNNR